MTNRVSFICCVIIVLVFSTAPLFGQTDISGRWTGAMVEDQFGIRSAFSVTFGQSGATLSGSLTGGSNLDPSQTSPLSGTLTGTTIAFQAGTFLGDPSIVQKFSGSVAGNRITGTWQIPFLQIAGGLGSGTFQLDRQGSTPPTITSLVPSSAVAGGPAFILTVNGTNLTSNTVVRWNGVGRSTRWISSNQVTASIQSEDIARAGTAQITVRDDQVGGLLSNVLPFQITGGTVPTISTTGVLNAASFALGPVAPGSIISVFGTNLASATASTPGVPLPTTLGGAALRFNNSLAVPEFYASPSQINAQVPWELAGQTQASLVDTVGGVTGAPTTVQLAPYAPGIFTVGGAAGAILHGANNQLVTSLSPAVMGEVVVIYGTGLGDVTNRPSTGSASPSNPLATTRVTPTAAIGGVSAPVLFSGLAPGFIGLYQVNVQVPSNVSAGNAVSVVLTIAGATSNSATIAVQATASSGPATVFSSFGPGDGYNSTSGYSLGGGAWNGNSGFTIAAPFTPSVTNLLSKVELALVLDARSSGQNTLSVWLMSDAGGLPGAILETYSFSNVLTTRPAILSANSVIRPMLQSGVQYWIATAPSDLINVGAAWLLNTVGASGPVSRRTGSGAWATASAILPAFRVTAGDSSPFILVGSMITARAGHTATLLKNGKVLIAGAFNGSELNPTYLATAELYDPSTRAFTATGSMITARAGHTATLLNNGKVLIAGGSNGSGHLATAELYDPSTGTFTATGRMIIAGYFRTATLLNNGKVLIAGGSNGSGYLATAELYDPSTGTFTATGRMIIARYSHTATLLNNGKVLIVGGYNQSSVLTTAELYDPSAGTFTATGSMTTARYFHTATLLNNGKVLIAGGGAAANRILATSERYDPSAGTFTATGSMTAARYFHTATLLNNGKVLIAGGSAGTGDLETAELYDPSTGPFTATGSMTTARYSHNATLLNNGKVLIVGGRHQGSIATAELYQPPLQVTTVFLVHGIRQDSSDMSTFGQNLRAALDPSLFAVDAGFDFGYCARAGSSCPSDCTLGGTTVTTINNGARALGAYIDLRRPPGDVIVIGYSMGGLIARDMIVNGFANYRVKALVTLGTPNLGYPYESTVDDRLSCPNLSRQMDGDFINPAQGSRIDLCLNGSTLDKCVAGDIRIAAVSPYLYDLNRSWTSLSLAGRPSSWLTLAGTFCANYVRVLPSSKGCLAGTLNDGVVCEDSARFNVRFGDFNSSPTQRVPAQAGQMNQYAHTDTVFTSGIFCNSSSHPVLSDPGLDFLKEITDFIER